MLRRVLLANGAPSTLVNNSVRDRVGLAAVVQRVSGKMASDAARELQGFYVQVGARLYAWCSRSLYAPGLIWRRRAR